MTNQQKTQANVSRLEKWPRIALVTPVFNSGKYIEATIESVLAQDYPNLDYFIVDGGSTDRTIEIIRKYEAHVAGWISEPDNGMYDAINKGFARTSGDVMGWISATDMFHRGGLRAVGAIFHSLPDVEWITGRPTRFNEQGITISIDPIPHWSRARFLAGFNRYIQQESTFWRRSLWNKAGGYVDSNLRMAGDFELWIRFFRHAKLHPVDTIVGGFRVHGASLGLKQIDECHRIQDRLIANELAQGSHAASLFRSLSSVIKRIPFVRFAWWRTVEKWLPHIPGPDWAPVIRCINENEWLLGGR